MPTVRRPTVRLLLLSIYFKNALSFTAAPGRLWVSHGRTSSSSSSSSSSGVLHRGRVTTMASTSQATPTTATGETGESVTAETSASSLYSPTELVSALIDASANSAPLDVQGIFAAMSRSPIFMKEIWEKRPFYCDNSLPSLAGKYTLADIQEAVDADFVEAGRGTFNEGSTGWRMAEVSQPRGKSFEDAKLRFEDIQRALKEKSGTVVVNSAGAYIRPLAGICLDVMQALNIPVCLNLYITAAGQKTSAPPHTDKQDVFVMQTQGRKRWRVFQPPAPNAKPNADPMARGKGADVLSLGELIGEGKSGALLDVVLEPGQLLYVPAGFPHTTDTVTGMTDRNNDPSVHLTVGLDTHIWGLNYATLRDYSLRRAGVPDAVKFPLESSLREAEYWKLFSALPMGFLGEEAMAGFGRWSEMKQAQLDMMTSTAVEIERDVQTGRGEDSVPDDEVLGGSELGTVAQRLVDHHAKVTAIFKEMYGDVRHGLTPVPRDSSFLRSRPYLDLVEKTMSQLVHWGMAGTTAAAPPMPEATPAAAAAAAAAAVVDSKGGFGGGAAAASGGGKKAAASKKKKSKRK